MLKSCKMRQIPTWVLFISCFLLSHTTHSLVQEEAKASLISFLGNLSGSNGQPDPSVGWDIFTDPCENLWKGVVCDTRFNNSVKRLYLNYSNLAGIFDAVSLCSANSLVESLSVIDLDGNSISGHIPAEIARCYQLTRLSISRNQFHGSLPDSISTLRNLKKLDISYNKFSGNLPDLSKISGLQYFLAQYNQLTGRIPNFVFSNFNEFNVSFNNFLGAIPYGGDKVPPSSFINNPELCGPPLPKLCTNYSASNNSKPEDKKSSDGSRNNNIMYAGYAVLGLAFITFIIWRLHKRRRREDKVDPVNKIALVDDGSNKHSVASSEYKTGVSRSEFSVNSNESAMVSSSLVVLTSPVVNGLKFEDLLRAPAELLGRGKYGILYKAFYDNGMVLAVKRIKDWALPGNEFKQRMQRIDQAKHPNVLQALAFYCSKQEKLLVYQYQQNGSLFNLLHGTNKGRTFDWGSRLGVAAAIAAALAFMHQELRDEGIAHGNLKSSNILLNKNMEPCISEYGLMVMDSQDSSSLANVNASNSKGMQQTGAASSAFKLDICGFGLILLELLTGKLAQENGVDLATWVHSVVREEWTVEVFDKSLISEGASEERMVNLLQVAIKCVSQSPEARPGINQVAVVVNAIKEEEERSVAYEP